MFKLPKSLKVYMLYIYYTFSLLKKKYKKMSLKNPNTLLRALLSILVFYL